MKRRSSVGAALTLAGLAAAYAPDIAAQDRPQGPPRNTGWQIEGGAVSIFGPRFLGTSDYRILPVPFLDVKYDEWFFLNVQKGLGFYGIDHQTSNGTRIRWGASIAPGFDSRNSGDIPGLESVGISIEARSFVDINYRNWGFSATVARDLGTGHDGFYGEGQISYSNRIGQKGFGQISLSGRYADENFMNSFYTVNQAGSAASGLNRFNADAGFESIAVGGLYAYRFNNRWTASVISNARLAVGDAADSPITDTNFGVTVVTAISYRF